MCPAIHVISRSFFIALTKYITWVSDNKVSWTLNAPGIGPDPTVEISARQVSQEPMVGFTRLLVTSQIL